MLGPLFWRCFGVLALGGVVGCGSENGDPTGVVQSPQIVPPAAGTAPAIGPGLRPPGKRVTIASAGSLLDVIVKGSGAPARSFIVPGAGGDVPVLVEVYREVDGKVSVQGRVLGSEDSEVSFTASDQTFDGWIVDPRRSAAFAYDSDADGNVGVETVPLD